MRLTRNFVRTEQSVFISESHSGKIRSATEQQHYVCGGRLPFLFKQNKCWVAFNYPLLLILSISSAIPLSFSKWPSPIWRERSTTSLSAVAHRFHSSIIYDIIIHVSQPDIGFNQAKWYSQFSSTDPSVLLPATCSSSSASEFPHYRVSVLLDTVPKFGLSNNQRFYVYFLQIFRKFPRPASK